MNQIRNVYIVEPIDQGWIIERLMRDIASELNGRGIPTRIGQSASYEGEDVIFNSRYLTARSDPRARVNSLFVTHVDDKIKELELRAAFKRFNSFVCMSPQDANFVAALGGSQTGTVGIDLPTRDLKVRPVRLALFSAFYEDGRKNEQWIAEYFRDKSSEYRENFVFCFMGWGWERFCAELGGMEMNYEIYRYSRFMPGEYDLYKEVLATMDTLIYLGFDGGAMSVYDGINAGLGVIASNISYHQDLGDAVSLIDNKDGFFKALDHLHGQRVARKASLQQRSATKYTTNLVQHWNSLVQLNPAPSRGLEGDSAPLVDPAALNLVRDQYKTLSASRIRSALIRWVQSRLLR